MIVERVSTLTQLESLKPSWDRLTSGCPFRSWEWSANWWKHYGSAFEMCVLAIRDDCGQLTGVAPWFVEQSRSRGRVLRAFGSGEVCTDYTTILSRPDCEEQVGDTVARWLAVESQLDPAHGLGWDRLELDGVLDSDRLTHHVLEQCGLAEQTVSKLPAMNCWRIELPESWGEYLRLLSKSHRKQINRLFESYVATGIAEWRVTSTEDELQSSFNTLIALHQKRWKLAGEPGVFASDRFRNFLWETTRDLFHGGRARLCQLNFAGQPAAVDLQFLQNDTVFVYQGGIEPALFEQSPGKLLTAWSIKHAIEERRRHFDFLRGDEPYKPHFRAQPTPTFGVRVIPCHTSARVRHGVWMAGVTVKNWIKSSLNLPRSSY